MYMGVVLYAPCLALETITGLPIFALILLSGITGTIYTVLVSPFCNTQRALLNFLFLCTICLEVPLINAIKLKRLFMYFTEKLVIIRSFYILITGR